MLYFILQSSRTIASNSRPTLADKLRTVRQIDWQIDRRQTQSPHGTVAMDKSTLNIIWKNARKRERMINYYRLYSIAQCIHSWVCVSQHKKTRAEHGTKDITKHISKLHDIYTNVYMRVCVCVCVYILRKIAKKIKKTFEWLKANGCTWLQVENSLMNRGWARTSLCGLILETLGVTF